MGSTYNKNKKINRYGVPRNRIGYLRNLTCKRNKGKIVIRSDGYCLDQISIDENKWFYNKSRYLMKTYGLTIIQYYNLCMYGSPLIYPVCRYCGRELQFRELNYGYYPVCSSKKCKSLNRSEISYFNSEELKDLNRKRITEYNNEIKWKNKSKDYRRSTLDNFISESLKSRRNNRKLIKDESRRVKVKNEIYRLVNMLIGCDLYSIFRDWSLTPDKIIEFTRNSFLSRGEPDDLCSFYIATLRNGNFKFGVSKNFELRSKLGNYKNIKPIVTSTRIKVAYLEYNIKMDLKLTKEELPWSDVRLFMNSFNKFIDDIL